MSRGFGSAFGVNTTSDFIILNYSTAPSTSMSYSIWAYIHGAGGGNFGNFWSQVPPGITGNSSLNMNNGTSTIGFNAVWTGGDLFWTFTCPSLNVWHNILITYNASAIGNSPTVYVDGISQAVTPNGASSGSFGKVSEPYYIGNNHYNSHTTAHNGMLSDFAVWNGIILTSSDALVLACGCSPLLVRPDSLVVYTPLLGSSDGVVEPDYVGGFSTTTFGTAKGTSDAPIMPLKLNSSRLKESYIPLNIAAAFALSQMTQSFALAAKEVFSASVPLHQAAQSIALTIIELFTAITIQLTQPGNSLSIDCLTNSLTRWQFNEPTNVPRRKNAPQLEQIRTNKPGLTQIRSTKEILGD